ncbi:hypothetical protein KIW84_023813 [Lathyrus oleraceus]|uniref:Uncharacterized protein n=1 Tax=Pisum sativum TaxID=3888 RepID=A0A9D5BBM5_PEA|nr:hypothetical protein KIW84_023813 [Pisum sativum]
MVLKNTDNEKKWTDLPMMACVEQHQMLWNISPSEKVSEKLVISGWNAASEAKVMFGELKGCPARMKWMLVFKGKCKSSLLQLQL